LRKIIESIAHVKFRLCDISKETQSLKLGEACSFDGIPNEYLRHLRPLVRLTHLFNHRLRVCHLPAPWKEAKIITLPNPGKDSKFPQNLRLISLLSTTGKLYEELILRTIQRHIEERNLLNTSQFGFRAHHSTTVQCMRLTDHVIEKATDTTWHSGQLYKLSQLECSTSLIKLIAYFLTNRKFKASIEGEFSTPREIAAGVPQGSVLAPVLYSLYVNNASVAPGINLSLFTDDTCIYMTEKHECRVLCKLQCDLTAVKSWCVCAGT
jgi:hypothetical protein